jgi:hypothetical protein
MKVRRVQGGFLYFGRKVIIFAIFGIFSTDF